MQRKGFPGKSAIGLPGYGRSKREEAALPWDIKFNVNLNRPQTTNKNSFVIVVIHAERERGRLRKGHASFYEISPVSTSLTGKGWQKERTPAV